MRDILGKLFFTRAGDSIDQPQAAAGILAREAAIQLDKRLEKTNKIHRSNPDAGVPHGELHFFIGGIPGNIQANAAACRRKLDGVAQQVDQNLLEPSFVGHNRGHRVVYVQ